MSSLENFTNVSRDIVDTITQALANREFYLEAMLFCGTLAFSLFLSLILQQFLKKRISLSASARIQAFNPDKLLKLIPPFIFTVVLASSKSLAESYEMHVWLFDASAKLSAAWLLTGFVLLFIRTRPVAFFAAAVIFVVTVLSVAGFLDATTEFFDGVGFTLGKYNLTLLGLIKGLIMFILVFWMAGAISRTSESYLRRYSSISYNARELIVKFMTIFFYFVAAMVTLDVVGFDLTAFAVFGGALGVGIGLGLQQITSNFVSGVSILAEKSIKMGDLIEVDGEFGWIRHLSMRYALLETFDGREVIIPNETLTNNKVTNWTYNNTRARIEIPVGVSYKSDLALVRKLILDSAVEHALSLKDPAPNCFLREYGDSSVNFLLVFWIGDVRDGRWGPQSEVMFTIWDKFAAHNIEIPFPQRVVHMVPPPGEEKEDRDQRG